MPNKSQPLREAFECRVTKSDGCWIWKGTIQNTGYGAVKHCGRLYSAHRLSYEFYNGKIPKGLWVLHKCDVRKCVSPKHLFVGTVKDNQVDMASKFRAGNQDFTAEQVRYIRNLYAGGGISMAAIAKMYDAYDSTICNIIIRKTYGYVS